MSAKTIYLDHATATQPSATAIGRMLPFLTDNWGASSSPHRMGQRLYPDIEEGYRSLYALMGARDEDTIILTSSGAEAVNQVIQGVYHEITRTTGKNQFLTSAADEAPAIMAIGRLEPLGCVGKRVEINSQGFVSVQAVADALSPRTALLSLSWANGLTGVVHPVAEIAKLCRERGVLLHLDATHVLGKLYFDLDEIAPDFVSFHGDALHGPKGTGALYIRNGRRLPALIAGGLSQHGLRGGDLSVGALVGLGIASREALDARDLLGTEVARLRLKLENGLRSGYPGACVLFRDQERVPHICAVSFPGVVNEALLFALNRQGICCSMGGGVFQQIGLVLSAAGLPPTIAHCALSFGLSRGTREDEIDKAISVICTTASRLRTLSQQIVGD